MRRKLLPIMPGAVTGNGRMLALLKETGEVYRLFWPAIDQAQHLGQLWVGVRETAPVPGEVSWFHEPSWYGNQRYLEDTAVVLTSRRHEEAGLAVEHTDFVLFDTDVLVRYFRLTNSSSRSRTFHLVVYCTFLIDESALYDTIYLEFSRRALIQFRRDTFLALCAPGLPLAGYHTGRRDTFGDPLSPAVQGHFYGQSSTLRAGAGALAWELGEVPPGESRDFTLYLAAANSEAAVLKLLAEAGRRSGPKWLEATAARWKAWLGSAPGEPAVRRSLVVLKLLTNRDTGASIAAPEFDPFYLQCGGYGYCWPRDGTYAALAFDQCGYHEEARAFYLFAVRVQNKDGSWQQRYFTSGSWAPTWGQQIDQVGTVLWGYYNHYRLTGDRSFLAQVWPSVLAGAAYLLGNLSPENGLPGASLDLWEDNFVQSTYAAAATCGGLTGAAKLAREMGETARSEAWEQAAQKIKSAIPAYLWDPRRQCFLRGINRQVGHHDYQRAKEEGVHAWTDRDPLGIYTTYWVARDPRLDAAALGLVFPFGVLDPLDPLVENTLKRLEEALTSPAVGGLYRYEGDGYAGGNPWVVTTLWLGIVRALRGEREAAAALYRWALHNASPTGLLPEQVHRERGGPAWVLPLGWSHAMLVLLDLALKGKLVL
ncbi:glycoside hydrolase family 15 protein [Desulfovirgula thermocuniculi]|uniref:glycoside hydrolase family 15 protein n=1 Tax=Desulfovirgula thermocuniculi TaxID=348842 RepID=UPI000688D798|nr:glycoside hydrolase family 15 protein [Desulfovirgula thermocuniculi]